MADLGATHEGTAPSLCYAFSMLPTRSSFDVLAELFARDVDRDLLRRSLARTPTERILWLEEMQAFAEDARKARARATNAASSTPR